MQTLAAETAGAGKLLVERLAIYPGYAVGGASWLVPKLHTAVLRAIVAGGFARVELWNLRAEVPPPAEELRYVPAL